MAHWSRILCRRAESSVMRVGQAEAADQVEGGLHQLAYAGHRLVHAERLDESAGGWPDRVLRSSSTTASCSAASLRAATHSSRAASKMSLENCSPRTCTTASDPVRSVRQLPRGRRGAPRRGTSARCSTAAMTRSFFVGKWCSWAPRLTPARSETSVVDVPVQPFSTRHSMVASSRRCRMARVRSSWGTRAGAADDVMSPSWLSDKQTVKPDFSLR